MGQMPLRVLLILLLIIPTPHLFPQSSASNSNSQDLASDQIFRPPMADQTEPASRIRYGGKYLDFGLALPLAFYTSEGKNSAWQVGFLGGSAAGFGSERTSLHLGAAVFHAGALISARISSRSAAFSLSITAAKWRNGLLPTMRPITSESTGGRAFWCERIPASDDGHFRPGRNGSLLHFQVTAGASTLRMTFRRAERWRGVQTSASSRAFSGPRGRASRWRAWRRGFTADRNPLANFSSAVSASWAHN